MKKFILLILLCLLCKAHAVYADMALLYFILSGASLANGVYMDDKKNELKDKSKQYHNLGTAAQHDAEAAAYLSGVYDTMATVASEFNQMNLFTTYSTKAEEFYQMSVDYQDQSEQHFNQSRSKEKNATNYEWYAGTSYAAGGILLFKGIWDIVRKNRSWDTYGKQTENKSWYIETYALPGKAEILLTKRF